MAAADNFLPGLAQIGAFYLRLRSRSRLPGQPARMSTDHQPAIVLFGNNKGLRVILQISHRRQPPSHSCCGNVVFVKYAFGTGDLSVLLIPSCHLASSIMNDAPAKLQLLAFQLPEGKIVGGEETDSPSCER